MSDWTKEPWHIEGDGTASVRAEDAHGEIVLAPILWQKHLNYDRAIACVNALVGFPDPDADVRALVEALEAAQNALENVPFVGEKYDQQHSDTHMRAWQKINDLLNRLRREP